MSLRRSATLFRQLCFSKGISGGPCVCSGVVRSPQTKSVRFYSLIRPHFTSSPVYSQHEQFSCSVSPSLNRTWQRYLSSSSEGASEEGLKWYDIDTPEFAKIVASYRDGTAAGVSLIDVREPEELAESGKVPGTINIPLGTVGEALNMEAGVFEKCYGAPKPALDSDIIFHCKAGVRSLVAMDTANKLGYSRARHYVRGYNGWQNYMEGK